MSNMPRERLIEISSPITALNLLLRNHRMKDYTCTQFEKLPTQFHLKWHKEKNYIQPHASSTMKFALFSRTPTWPNPRVE